ncbi:hypothetical protein TWF281_002666 [Arthrobotrys megalospora]
MAEQQQQQQSSSTSFSPLPPRNINKPIPIFTPLQRLPAKPSFPPPFYPQDQQPSSPTIAIGIQGAGLQKPISMQSTVSPPRTNEELTPLIDAHILKVLEDLNSEKEYTPQIVKDLSKPTEELAQTIDHTLLKPEATEDQIKSLCEEAVQHGFKSCCINPTHVRLVATTLSETTKTIPCSVIGFPLGTSSTSSKCYESSLAILDGAKEIDMVIPIGHLLSKNYSYVYNDILSVVRATKGLPVKVIIETSLVKTQEEKIAACWIAAEAGAMWVKTSTGFSGGGATVEDVRLMRLAVAHKEGVKVKASGGVRNFEQAINMIKAGASRIGTSNGVAIMADQEKKEASGSEKKEESY